MSQNIAGSEIDATQASLLEEIRELRHRLLPRFLYVLATCFVIWLLWSCWQSETVSFSEIAWAVLASAGLLAAKIYAHHFRAAAWVLVLGITVGLMLLQLECPNAVIIAMGVLGLIVASSVLSFVEALLVGALVYVALVGIWLQAGPGSISVADAQSWAVFYILALVGVQIGQSPMREATHLALEGWVQLRNSLLQARERRGELHRVAHALEEATYRVERMNNELTLARYQAELARANKVQFAATVSHEMRGPLNLILGFARLMALSPERYGVPLPREYRADIDTIYASSRHLADLLDDVLDLSQAEVDRMPLIKEWIDLRSVLAEAEEVVRPLIDRKGLTLDCERGTSSIMVPADPVRIRQVLLNLLTNAVRFTERGGIWVTVAELDDQVVVSVRDTGRGIRRQDLPRLFQEFSQLSLEHEPRQGSGLGLAISRHLVELHGGRIWAESQEGSGTTVHFSVPVTDRPPSGVHRMRPPAARAPQQRDVVVIAHEDHAMIRFLARQLEDFEVVAIPGLSTLTAVAESHWPKAIVLDTAWADEAAKALDEAGLPVPLVVCSMPNPSDSPAVDRPVSYLMKPITKEMLEATLREFIPAGDDLKVLIVDDDPDAVRLLEAMLQQGSLPRTVLRANSGYHAIEVMLETRPDLVLMDLVMPGLDGQATISRMREDPRLCDIPVVMISARDSTGDRSILGSYLEVRVPGPVAEGEAIRRLRAVLETLSPVYLPSVETCEPSREAPQDR